MAEIVTLELPETLAQRVKEIAALTNRRIEDVLAAKSGNPLINRIEKLGLKSNTSFSVLPVCPVFQVQSNVQRCLCNAANPELL